MQKWGSQKEGWSVWLCAAPGWVTLSQSSLQPYCFSFPSTFLFPLFTLCPSCPSVSAPFIASLPRSICVTNTPVKMWTLPLPRKVPSGSWVCPSPLQAHDSDFSLCAVSQSKESYSHALSHLGYSARLDVLRFISFVAWISSTPFCSLPLYVVMAPFSFLILVTFALLLFCHEYSVL